MGTNTAGGNRSRLKVVRAVGSVALALTIGGGLCGALGATAAVQAATGTSNDGLLAGTASIISTIGSLVPLTRDSERDGQAAQAQAGKQAEPGAPVTSNADMVTPDGTLIETANGAISAIESDFHVEPILSPVLAAEWRYGGADDVDADPEPATAAAPIQTAKPATTTTKSSSVVLRAYGFSFPAIGVRAQGTAYFGCGAPGSLGNAIYRWGCAGRNNTYLLGHAWGVFKPLNAAYHAGTLKVGQIAWYAGRDGVARQYKVTAIRHVKMADWASWGSWAKAAQSRPSLTLQTCDGAGDVYRIVVRLTLV